MIVSRQRGGSTRPRAGELQQSKSQQSLQPRTPSQSLPAFVPSIRAAAAIALSAPVVVAAVVASEDVQPASREEVWTSFQAKFKFTQGKGVLGPLTPGPSDQPSAQLCVNIVSKSAPFHFAPNFRRAAPQLRARRAAAASLPQKETWNVLRCARHGCEETFRFQADESTWEGTWNEKVKAHWGQCRPSWQQGARAMVKSGIDRRHNAKRRGVAAATECKEADEEEVPPRGQRRQHPRRKRRKVSGESAAHCQRLRQCQRQQPPMFPPGPLVSPVSEFLASPLQLPLECLATPPPGTPLLDDSSLLFPASPVEAVQPTSNTGTFSLEWPSEHGVETLHDDYQSHSHLNRYN